MNIFNKYLMKSVVEKKGRLVLLVCSISISVALVISCLSAISILIDTFTNQAKGSYGEYNVKITSKSDKNKNLFNKDEFKVNNIEQILKVIELPGYIVKDTNKEFIASGVYLEELKNFKAMKIISEDGLEPFEGKKIAISKKTKENLGVNLGESIKLNIFGDEKEYKVVAIYDNTGMFAYDGEQSFGIITPKENIFSILKQDNKYSYMLGQVKADDLDAWVKSFNDENKQNDISVVKTYDEKSIKDQLEWIQGPLFFMLAIVLIMTTYIIYCSFKLIISERLSVIGTFLSQGATMGKVVWLLLKESSVYGIIGGIIGSILGTIFVNIIKYFANITTELSTTLLNSINTEYLIFGFIFAIVFSMITSTFPILSIRKLPVKEVVLNKISVPEISGNKNFIIGLLIILIAFIVNLFEPKINYIGSIPSVSIFLVGSVLVVSKLVRVICYPITRLMRGRTSTGMLAFNNVSTSKVLMNNITLISISVMSIIIISSLGSSIVNVINGSYKQMNFDISLRVNSINLKEVNEKVKDIVDKDYIYETGRLETYKDGDVSKPINVYYVDTQKYVKFESYMTYKDKEKQLKELDENDDGIILCTRAAKNYSVKVGDEINLEANNKTVKLKVLSIVDPRMFASGNYNIISKSAALKHFGIEFPRQYYLSTNKTKDNIKDKVKGLGVEVNTKEEIIEDEQENMKQFVDVLTIFSFMTMIIGGFGIISNVSISFIQRKRDLAIMSSVGLDKSNKRYLIMIEAIAQAMLGTLSGLVAGFGVIILIKSVFKFLMLDLTLDYPSNLILLIFATTVGLMIMTSVSSMIKSGKLDLVKELKYE